MTKNQTQEPPDNDLDSLYAELAEREAKIVQRENALREKEAAQLVAGTPAVPAIGLTEAELDLSTAPQQAKQGRAPQAAAAHRKSYGKWLRENYPGRTPLKRFHVTLKKKNTDDRSFNLQAVDEIDARRQAYQQAGITQKTEAFNAIVQRA
ncbi:hypothetical protein [Bremerella alba]|uniref:Uncharacterized protein n=1 Tax=Bremerella alba TaxID=980252 RepID=A0A7V8V8B4_9BACT|nr:hypothetical protein [Bremerella alba]MBA2116793.1 hypothetical protein [Bremerella alba]